MAVRLENCCLCIATKHTFRKGSADADKIVKLLLRGSTPERLPSRKPCQPSLPARLSEASGHGMKPGLLHR